ncbi:MAG TPA: hypothetical protein VIX17_05010 [Pyrinomonadaceae bacterium]
MSSFSLFVLLILLTTSTDAQKPELVLQTGATNGIETVAFSADGRTIITSTHGGASSRSGASFQIWDVTNGGLIRTINGEDIGIAYSLAVSPDGLRLVVVTGDLFVFSSQTGKLLWKRGSTDDAQLTHDQFDQVATKSVSFSPDSKYLFSFTGRFVKIWDPARGNLISNLTQADSAVFAPAGNYIVTELKGVLSVWETSNLRLVRKFNTAATGISIDTIAFSEDGEMFTSTKNGRLNAWRLKTGESVRSFKTASTTPYARALVDHGKLFAELDRDGLRVYDLETGKPKLEWIGQRSIYTQLVNRQYDEAPNSGLITFSPNGKVLAIADDYNIALFDVTNGKKIITLGGGVEGSTIVNVSPDQRTIAIAAANMIQIWRTDTGAITTTLKSPIREKQEDGSEYLGFAADIVFSPDSNRMAVLWAGLHPSNILSVFDPVSGATIWTHGHKEDPVIGNVRFSADGTKLAYSQSNKILVCDSATGALFKSIAIASDQFEFSLQRDTVVSYELKGRELTLNRVNLESGHTSSQLLKGLLPNFDPQDVIRNAYVKLNRGGTLLAVRNGAMIHVVDTSGASAMRSLSTGRPVSDFELSPSGKFLVTTGENMEKSLSNGQSVRDEDNAIKLWSVETGRLLRSFTSGDTSWLDVKDVYFSDDERHVVLHEGCEGGCWQGRFRVWDITNEAELGAFRFDVLQTHRPFSFYDSIFLLADESGVRFYSLKQNSTQNSRSRQRSSTEPLPISRLALFPGGAWAVVDALGNFDTNNLDSIPYVRWFISDAPLTAYPPEIFMRDYYQPRLMARVLNEQKIPDLPSLAELNRNQPRIESIRVVAESNNPELVTVNVEVASTAGQCLKGTSHVPCESGVYDLRLYRDGQLVGQSPAPVINSSSIRLGQKRQEQLQQWRASRIVKTRQGRVVTAATGKQEIAFSGIHLPQRPGISQVDFTAYAFNEDRIKSATSEPAVYSLPQSRSGTVRRRAYVITVGVDITSAGWRLGFAPNGSREVEKFLKERLDSTFDVVSVPLISGYTENNVGIEDLATKGNLQAALTILAGGITQGLRLAIPQQLQGLRPATPDDLVVLYIASHGYADPQGKFYVIPSDIGDPSGVSEQLLDRCLQKPDQSRACENARAFLGRSISSDELTEWIEAIDAGQLLLVLDSCHSGAVSGPDFRPGPMGDRGFGQLSYDKGMLVLAASQAEQFDWGTLELGDRSLLTYALTQQQRTDGPFDFREWLSKAEKQVPILYRTFIKSAGAPTSSIHSDQEPLLFDFAKTRPSNK